LSTGWQNAGNKTAGVDDPYRGSDPYISNQPNVRWQLARKRRIDYPGAWHHVMNRGARKTPTFRTPDDCQDFLDITGETVAKFEWELHAYALMPNHFHLLIRSLKGTLSRGMQHLQGKYTQRLNSRYRWDGPVFRGRFKNQLVTDEKHLRVLIAYIHLNPVSANLVEGVDEGDWTSYRAYMGKEPVPKWLTTSFFTGLLGGRNRLQAFVEAHRSGRLDYPAEFEPETGRFKTPADERDERQDRYGCEGQRNHQLEQTLQRIHK
jgi:REP element-mobilizing transposase RayT